VSRLIPSIRAIFLKKAEAMLLNASALNGYPIKTTDGQLGTVAGLMYDPSDWAIRWLVVDTGDWLSGRRASLPVAAMGFHNLSVNLTMRQVGQCPDVDASEPAQKPDHDISAGSCLLCVGTPASPLLLDA
jgi:hypothetical protein